MIPSRRRINQVVQLYASSAHDCLVKLSAFIYEVSSFGSSMSRISELVTESGRVPSILPHPRTRSFDAAANLRRRRIKHFAMILAETGFLTPRDPDLEGVPKALSTSFSGFDSGKKNLQ